MGFKVLLSPCVYVYRGLLAIFKAIGSFIRYVFLGILAFPTMLVRIFVKDKTNNKKVTIEAKKTENRYKKTDILLAEHEREKEKKAKQEEKIRRKNQEIKEKKAQRRLNDYIQDTEKLEDKTAGEKIDKVGNKVLSFSDKIKNLLNAKIGDGGQVKDKYQDAEEMTINYEGPEAEKTKKKMTYEYIARTVEGKVIKGYWAAFSVVEVHSFLKSQGYKVYSIKTNQWINLMYGNVGGSHDKFKTHDYRHTMASGLYDNGVSIQTIRDYLGHNNEDMTKQYIDYMPKRIEQANTDYFRQPGNALAAGIIPKKRGEKTGK